MREYLNGHKQGKPLLIFPECQASSLLFTWRWKPNSPHSCRLQLSLRKKVDPLSGRHAWDKTAQVVVLMSCGETRYLSHNLQMIHSLQFFILSPILPQVALVFIFRHFSNNISFKLIFSFQLEIMQSSLGVMFTKNQKFNKQVFFISPLFVRDTFLCIKWSFHNEIKYKCFLKDWQPKSIFKELQDEDKMLIFYEKDQIRGSIQTDTIPPHVTKHIPEDNSVTVIIFNKWSQCQVIVSCSATTSPCAEQVLHIQTWQWFPPVISRNNVNKA